MSGGYQILSNRFDMSSGKHQALGFLSELYLGSHTWSDLQPDSVVIRLLFIESGMRNKDFPKIVL